MARWQPVRWRRARRSADPVTVLRSLLEMGMRRGQRVSVQRDKPAKWRRVLLYTWSLQSLRPNSLLPSCSPQQLPPTTHPPSSPLLSSLTHVFADHLFNTTIKKKIPEHRLTAISHLLCVFWENLSRIQNSDIFRRCPDLCCDSVRQTHPGTSSALLRRQSWSVSIRYYGMWWLKSDLA